MSPMLSNPSNRHRWFIIVSIVVTLVVTWLGMALHRALSSPPRFRASSLVLITPASSTSGVLAESFQERAFQSMPGVHLEQRGSPVSLRLWRTPPTRRRLRPTPTRLRTFWRVRRWRRWAAGFVSARCARRSEPGALPFSTRETVQQSSTWLHAIPSLA